MAPRAIFAQPPGDFPPPFGFFSRFRRLRANRDCFRNGNGTFFFGWDFADRTFHVRSEQQSATLRADSNHWFVLRRGVPQWNFSIVTRGRGRSHPQFQSSRRVSGNAAFGAAISVTDRTGRPTVLVLDGGFVTMIRTRRTMHVRLSVFHTRGVCQAFGRTADESQAVRWIRGARLRAFTSHVSLDFC